MYNVSPKQRTLWFKNMGSILKLQNKTTLEENFCFSFTLLCIEYINF